MICAPWRWALSATRALRPTRRSAGRSPRKSRRWACPRPWTLIDKAPRNVRPGLLAPGLEVLKNQWYRPWGLALGWTQSLHALKSGAGHEIAAFAQPLERGVFAPAEGSMRLPFVPFPRSQ